MSKLLLIGGGGHCKSVLDSLLSAGSYSAIGVVEKTRDQCEGTVLDIPVVGWDGELLEMYQKGYTHAFVTLGHIDNPKQRIYLYKRLKEIGYVISNVIDNSAIVSKNAVLGEGVFVGKNVVINAGAVIGNGVIVNTSVTIEHDCVVGDFVHIAPGAVLCGAVTVGSDSLIGANSVLKQQVSIGQNTIIGAGSVVVSDIPDNVVAYGNPCRVVKRND